MLILFNVLDLSDSTMNPKYRLSAKKYCDEAIKKFYDNNNKIFQKNEKNKNDIFTSPIDISDNTISNANSMMLINFSRLGYIEKANELSNSLNGYLNIYKNFMTSSLKALDFFNEIKLEKIVPQMGVKFEKKIYRMVYLVIFSNSLELWIS